jgi:hypothetical protein
MQRFLGVAVQALVLDDLSPVVRVAEQFDYPADQVDHVLATLVKQGRGELADGIARAAGAAIAHAKTCRELRESTRPRVTPEQPTAVAQPTSKRTRFSRPDGRPEFWSGYRDPVLGLTLYS